jgi:hypothetical protein
MKKDLPTALNPTGVSAERSGEKRQKQHALKKRKLLFIFSARAVVGNSEAK